MALHLVAVRSRSTRILGLIVGLAAVAVLFVVVWLVAFGYWALRIPERPRNRFLG